MSIAEETKLQWIGAFQFREILENSVSDKVPKPPEGNGVYVVSEKFWVVSPARVAEILYVGGNTGRSDRFRTRIGDLLADLLGFYGTTTGHHSGGQSLHRYCKQKAINPLDLWFGWADVQCKRCAEIDLFAELAPALNKIRPGACSTHISD